MRCEFFALRCVCIVCVGIERAVVFDVSREVDNLFTVPRCRKLVTTGAAFNATFFFHLCDVMFQRTQCESFYELKRRKRLEGWMVKIALIDSCSDIRVARDSSVLRLKIVVTVRSTNIYDLSTSAFSSFCSLTLVYVPNKSSLTYLSPLGHRAFAVVVVGITAWVHPRPYPCNY